jgi:hypothetical protein
MTPKEKAEELFTTYRFSLSIPNAPLGDLKDSIAKQCALMAVREIKRCIDWHIYPLDKEWRYWDEVNKELEKL